MKHQRIPIMRQVSRDGFTDWIQPKDPRRYLMVCCDCGLAHWMNFRVRDGKAQFRAKRAPRYTIKQRAKRKEEKS